MTVHVSDEVARRLEAEASARGVSVEHLAAEVLSDHVPVAAVSSSRRRLPFAAIGASAGGISDRVDALLADGFGRDWPLVLLVDTGPFVAAADRNDPHHRACLDLLESDGGPLVTTAMVVAETAYLLTRELGARAEPAFYDAIVEGMVTVEHLMVSDWRRIRDLVSRYQDLPLGGTDASLIAVAERLGVTRVATLDRAHFSVVRPAHCDGFELLP